MRRQRGRPLLDPEPSPLDLSPRARLDTLRSAPISRQGAANHLLGHHVPDSRTYKYVRTWRGMLLKNGGPKVSENPPRHSECRRGRAVLQFLRSAVTT